MLIMFASIELFKFAVMPILLLKSIFEPNSLRFLSLASAAACALAAATVY